ncbi:MAG: autotransporter-associated beta strand repeat-containing protein [Verrucomicrobia bacterium]|nr:autotransporter-associated beta strand repeat-containing protein [Verrucomicrobiota bacterium]
MKTTFSNPFLSALLALPIVVALGGSAMAQTINKGTTGTDLTAGASWVGGSAPGSGNVATWVTGSLGGALTIGSAQSWQGIDIQAATAAIATSGAGTLTLGSSGITIASGGVDLTLGNGVTFNASSNVNVASGKTLKLGTGGKTLTFGAGTTTTLTGVGNFIVGGSGATTVSGSGNVTINSGAYYRNYMQIGSGSSAYTGTTTLKSGGYLYTQTSLDSLGGSSAKFSIEGGTIGSDGGSGTRLIAGSAATTIIGDFTIANSGSTSALTFGSTGSLMDLGNGTRTITVSAATTFAGNISNGAGAGAGVLTKAGTGTLTLSGTNAYTGGSIVNNGYLAFSNVGAIPGTGSITASGSGSLVASGAQTTVMGWINSGNVSASSTGSIAITGNSSENIDFSANGGFNSLGLSSTGTATYSGTITTGTSGYIFGGSAANLTVSSNLSGSNALTKKDAGILILTGTNTFNGPIDMQNGDLVLNGTGSENGAPSLNMSGGRFILANPFVGQTATIGNLTGTAGIINCMYGSNAGTRTLQVNQTTDGSFAGKLMDQDTLPSSRNLALIKAGPATLTLSGGSNYTGGTTISQGTLVAANSSALGSGGTVTINDTNTGANNTALLLGDITMARPITVANQGSGTTTLGANSGASLPEFSGAITLAKAVTLDGAGNTDRLTFTGGIGGTGNVTIAGGADRVVFAGTAANTYNGTTTISTDSILQLGFGSSLATNLIPDASVLTVNSGGFLKLAKGANSETIGGLSGSGTVRGHEGVTGAASTLVIDSGTSQNFSGVLEDGGASGSTLSLTKQGAGALTLSGNNTYTGTTLVSGGTLLVIGALGDSAVTVGASGTIGGSGTLDGSLTLDDGARLDLTGASVAFSSTGVLTVASGKSITLSDFAFADILGWDAAAAEPGIYTLINGGGTVTLGGTTPTESNPFDFGNGKTGYFKQGSLQAVVIPEPSAILLGGLGLLGLLRRRRA